MSRWTQVRLSKLLKQRFDEHRIEDARNETFVTIRLYGKGAVQRKIEDGKTPVMKTGWRLRPGDLVYSRIDARNGAFALVPECLANAIVSKDFPSFEINRRLVIPEFLIRFLSTELFFAQLRVSSFGTTNRQRISEESLLSYSIPLPPLPEQERIVRILDEAEALYRLRAKADAKTDELIQELFYEFFGDPVMNERGWTPSSVGKQLSLLEYGPRFYNESYSATGPKIVRITDLDSRGNLNFETMPQLDVDEATLTARGLKPGDLIFARSGATVGKVALVPNNAPPCIAGAYFIRLRFAEAVDPVFAVELLRSTPIQGIIARQAKQAAQPNFSGPLIRVLPLPLPPVELQRRFSAHVAEIRALEAAQATSRKRLDDLSNSLLHSAFQGEL